MTPRYTSQAEKYQQFDLQHCLRTKVTAATSRAGPSWREGTQRQLPWVGVPVGQGTVHLWAPFTQSDLANTSCPVAQGDNNSGPLRVTEGSFVYRNCLHGTAQRCKFYFKLKLNFSFLFELFIPQTINGETQLYWSGEILKIPMAAAAGTNCMDKTAITEHPPLIRSPGNFTLPQDSPRGHPFTLMGGGCLHPG